MTPKAPPIYLSALLQRQKRRQVDWPTTTFPLRWSDALRGFNNSTPGDSGRRNVVRYDSPTLRRLHRRGGLGRRRYLGHGPDLQGGRSGISLFNRRAEPGLWSLRRQVIGSQSTTATCHGSSTSASITRSMRLVGRVSHYPAHTDGPIRFRRLRRSATMTRTMLSVARESRG